mgnify:FL=1
MSWNTKVGYLMVSGSDDGSFSIWDLRTFSYVSSEQLSWTTGLADLMGGRLCVHLRRPVAHFNWHKGPITSVEWNPHEESVLAVSSADNQVRLVAAPPNPSINQQPH